jgi:hypothetical protein
MEVGHTYRQSFVKDRFITDARTQLKKRLKATYSSCADHPSSRRLSSRAFGDFTYQRQSFFKHYLPVSLFQNKKCICNAEKTNDGCK